MFYSIYFNSWGHEITETWECILNKWKENCFPIGIWWRSISTNWWNMLSSYVIATKFLTTTRYLSTSLIFCRIRHSWATTFRLSLFTSLALHIPDSPPDSLAIVFTLLSLLFLHLTLKCECFRSWWYSFLVISSLPSSMVAVDSYPDGFHISWVSPLIVMVLMGKHVFIISRFPPATQISSKLLHLIECFMGISHNLIKQFKTGHLS